jgi:hypothetical protein
MSCIHSTTISTFVRAFLVDFRSDFINVTRHSIGFKVHVFIYILYCLLPVQNSSSYMSCKPDRMNRFAQFVYMVHKSYIV